MSETHTADPTAGTGGGALGAIDRTLHHFEKLTALLSGAGIFALMLIGVAQILGRKFFNYPIFGYIDMVEIMMSFLVFMGLAYTDRLGGHIRMEVVATLLPRRMLWLFEVVGVLISLGVIAVLTYYTWTHAVRAYSSGDSSMDAQILLWPSKLVVSLSLALLFVRLLVSLWGYVRLLIWPNVEPYGVAQIIDVEEQARRDAAAADLVEDPGKTGAP